MQKILKRKEAFIILLFLSILLINLPFITISLRPFESKNLPKSNSFPSEYSFDWYKDWGSFYNDYGTDVAVDSNGSIYICGYTDTTGSEDYDMVLIKYNKSGVELWSRTWGGPDDDIADCLVLDDSNNIYMAGYTKNAGDSDGDLYVVKFDSSGNYLTNVTWGGDDFDEARGIVRDSFGNIYVAGNTKSFGDLDGDSVLILFNSSLNQLWNSTWGGSLTEDTQDVEIDSEGYIYVVGHSDSMDPDADEYDNYILKYNSLGILQWAEDWDASWTQRGRSLAIDSNNNLYLIGYTFGHPAGSMKGLLLKYDKNGNYQWYQTFGSSGVYGNSWWSMTILPNDDIYIGGYSITHGVSTNGDSILLNYDTSGNLNWYKAWGDTGTESLYGLTYDSELNIYGAGSSSSVGAGEYDIIVLKYQNLPPTGEITIISPENKTYYEPMSGYYPGTYGFENEDSEGNPTGWTVEEAGFENVEILEELDGHKKILELFDTSEGTTNYARAYDDISTQTSGTVEWWFRRDGYQEYIHMRLWENFTTIPITISSASGNFQYNDGAWHNFATCKDNTWYHLRVDFECGTGSYQGLSADTFYAYIDEIRYGPYSFRDPADDLDTFEFLTRGWGTSSDYWGHFDAVGYSWAPNYEIGDNLNEGLLISYTISANLDWIGYSLDGDLNVTISGNTVIPLPENGIHSIGLNGITSTSISINSDIRYFNLDIQDSSLPPILPDELSVFPIILTCIGMGTIVLIGICLIVFRRRIFGRTSLVIIPAQKILKDERIDYGRDQVKFCPFCGNPTKNTNQFCANCGASLKNI